MKASYDKDILVDIVSKSFSISDVLKGLNLVPVGGNYKTVQKYIKLYAIDTTHFTGRLWNKGKEWVNIKARIPLEEVLTENSNFNSYSLKKRLFSENYKTKICEICNLSEWLFKPIALELHHINGINTDNRLENLQVLCPNCHAHTDNYRGKNQARKIEKDLNKSKHIINATKKVYLCSCGVKISSKAKSCRPCDKLKQRKTERPDKDTLLLELKNSSFVQVGKKYGVSDNAVRNWLKNYNKVLAL